MTDRAVAAREIPAGPVSGYSCMGDDAGTTGRTPAIDGRIERSLATAAGFLVVYGWLADEGHEPLRHQFSTDGHTIEPSCAVLLRYRRSDVEGKRGASDYDHGYLLFVRLGDELAGSSFKLTFSFLDRRCDFEVQPEVTSGKHLLEDVLAHLGAFQAHRGREAELRRFLASGARTLLKQMHEALVRHASTIQQSVFFGTAQRGPTFQTVVYGSTEAALYQPLLFASAGVCFGEWVYVCNTPQDAPDLLRYAQLTSKLHDLPIKVVILSDNAGFGPANNQAMTLAGPDVVLINPDVHVMPQHAALLNEALHHDEFEASLRGAVLFYDDDVLMHGGMYLAEDVHGGIRRIDDQPATYALLRVEHHDKGVPFAPAAWASPRSAHAVTGALMAFRRARFEQLGGFSSDFLFGHYEDADLCLRWREAGGEVEVDHRLRLVHLEGQGSKTKQPHFHGASLVNRYIFDQRVRGLRSAERAVRRDAQILSA